MIHKSTQHILREVNKIFSVEAYIVINADGSGGVYDTKDDRGVHPRLEWKGRTENDIYLEEWISAIELSGGVEGAMALSDKDWKVQKDFGIEDVAQEEGPTPNFV